MSFMNVDDILSMQEGFLQRVFRELMDVEIQLPLRRIKYSEAMARYGSDKPDTRFGYELCDISDVVKDSGFKVFSGAVASGGSVRAINAKGCASAYSRKEIDALGLETDEVSEDLHLSDRSAGTGPDEDYQSDDSEEFDGINASERFRTEYEEKFMKKGVKIKYVRLVK